jgi:hypothetical protein
MLIEKTKEAFVSVLPITLIVLLLSIVLAPMPISYFILFIFGSVMMIGGMGFFSLGADMSMMPLGEGIGIQLTKTRKIGLIVLVSFFMGFIVTIAEPDLQVLAEQVPAISDPVLIYTVCVGVGLFLILAILRILFKISFSLLLFILYGLVIVLSIFTPTNFVAVAFDAGGVTTGPITVPFIMAMGLGLAMIRADKDSKDDSFGLVTICSIGPILAVMLLGIIYNPQNAVYAPPVVPDIFTTQDVALAFSKELPVYFFDTLKSLSPVLLVFAGFQLISKRYKKRQIQKISVGFLYTLIGLVLFFTGVNVGFLPVGNFLGDAIGRRADNWILIPIGMAVGLVILFAEPAVHVLNKQVEEVSGGAITSRSMMIFLSVGTMVAVAIAMIRVLTGLSIYWFLVPGYVFSLVLTKFTPKIFTGIAFDSGGIASGTMTSTFILPIAIGVSNAVGTDIMTDAFGVVAMVAMAPLITIQLMGILYKKRMARVEEIDDKETEILAAEEDSDDIIVYEEDETNA